MVVYFGNGDIHGGDIHGGDIHGSEFQHHYPVAAKKGHHWLQQQGLQLGVAAAVGAAERNVSELKSLLTVIF